MIEYPDGTPSGHGAFGGERLVVIWGGIAQRPAVPPARAGGLCDCKCIEPAGWKSLSVAGLAAVTEWNCVLARGGGEHQEVNDRSVG